MKDEELVKKVEAAQRSLKRQKIWDSLTTTVIAVLVGLLIYGAAQRKVANDIDRIHDEVNKIVKPECIKENL